MKLNYKSNKSNLSTSIGTPLFTPPKKQKNSLFQPKIFQQKLRIRTKQTVHKNPKIKCNKKVQPLINMRKFNQIQQQNRQIDWISYNLINGIYQNWFRLSPYIIHLIQASRKDKLHDIQKLMQRITNQKQRIQKLLNKIKCSKQSLQFFQRKQSHQEQFINLQILDKINTLCNQFKCTTQLMNGQIFAQKRIIKSQKQNILADHLFSDLIKINKQNKNVCINDNVTKVAETIVDRIAVVKSLKSKNIKIDKKILKPLQKMFIDSSKLEKEPMTIDNVIKQIIQKFVKVKNTHQNEQNTLKKDFQDQKLIQNSNKQQQRQDFQNQALQNIKQDLLSIRLIQQDNNQNKTQSNQIQKIKTATKKKIVFKIDSQSESEQQVKLGRKRLEMLHYNSKRNYERELSKNKNKSKKRLLYNLNDDQQDVISRTKEGKYQKKKTNKSQKSLHNLKFDQNQISSKEDNHTGSNLQKDSQHMSELFKKNLSRENSYQCSSDTLEQLVQFDKGPKSRFIRRRNLKKHTFNFDILDLQNFDMELKAEQNVVIKKKKILDLFNNLQTQGASTSKSIKKILTYAHKMEQDIKTKNNLLKQKIKRNNLSEDGAIASFFRIPLNDANKKYQHCCKPYQYLTKFNKQAVQNWNSNRLRIFRLSDVPKARFSELGCDLSIPMIQKQTSYHHRKWFDRQNKALQFSLSLVRKRNMMAISQKPLYIQKQNVI